MALSALAGLAGWAVGAPGLFIIGAVAVLWLPALAAFMPLHWSRESQSFQVLGWTLIAVVCLALSGGVRSPLTVLFALGPLTGLFLSNRKVAVEAAIFSAIAFFSFWLLTFWIEPPQLPQNLAGFTTALSFAAIVYAGLLSVIAMAGMRIQSTAPAEANEPPPVVELSPGSRNGVHLPAAFPFTVISITPQGRIRAIDGNRGLVEHLQIGDVAIDALARLFPGIDEAFFASDSETDVVADGVGNLRIRSLKLDNGPAVLVSQTESTERDIDKALQERTAFFASLGHDLKTPLNAIIGFADMMRSGIRGPLPEAYQDYSEIIQESGQDLLLLVDDILDLAKADANKLKLELEAVDLAASAASILRQLSAQAERANVVLKLGASDEVWAEADARAVRQIFQNLVSNAIKYSEAGGEVILETGEQDEGVFVSVEDFGAGMDEADLQRIAEPFSKGTNARGRVGTGLGLAVVKQFADLHGGQVKIETAKGRGTRVEVTFRPADLSSIDDFEKAAQ